MNISHRWLLTLAPTIVGEPRDIAKRLGMLGAPVDELVEVGTALGDILIARVTDVSAHPDADRLRVCVVDAGGEPLQVVCGAPNVEAGRYYPFAPVGASLPGGVQIRKAKLRGQVSQGMLCSARELGLGRDHTGLMELAGEWTPGLNFVNEVGLIDALLVLDITPNRSDLLSHVGVARELAPGGVADIRLEPFSGEQVPLALVASTEARGTGAVPVTLEDPDACPRYLAAVVEGVAIGPSPEWLAMRLRTIGVRPINNVVDATNYVLHELGQPLHAFDLDRVAGPEIRVRRAHRGETLRTLDGIDRTLDPSSLVIADRDRAVALAGVMGGEDSEVTARTTRILIECANFDPRVVRAMARGMGLSTDASYRFERGVDADGQPAAMERVVDLILAVAGGRVAGPVTEARGEPRGRARLVVRPNRVRQVLGVEPDHREMESLLGPIGFGVGAVDTDGAIPIEVPGYRPDVTREIDVIEEVARRRGYDSFSAELRAFRPSAVPAAPIIGMQRTAHQLFSRRGFLEARTAAFAPAAEGRVALLNPLSAEESHLRDDLIGGLIRRVQHNWAHGVHAIRLYEIGTVFRGAEGPVPGEEVRAAAIFTGPSSPAHWSEPSRVFDVWDLKGLLVEAGHAWADAVEVRPDPVASPWLEPAESFVVVARGRDALGVGGRVRDVALDAPKWAAPVWAVEFVLREGERPMTPVFADLPAFPPVDRDLALVIPGGVSAADVEKVLRGGGELLEEVTPFDVYQGEGLAPGSRSIAWRLRFRHPGRTLTDADVERPMNQILKGLEELGVHRR